MVNNFKLIINKEFNSHLEVTQKTFDNIVGNIELSAEMCIESLKNGKKILLCGNGGSAADAQHIAAEIVGRYKSDRHGLPAIALTTDTSILTAVGNDFGFQHIFDRQVQALANEGDIVIGISTGGSSINVINALKLAKSKKCKLIGLSGKDGGEFNNLCDFNLVVPSEDTPRIQELHILIGHTICQLIDEAFIYGV
jgi:D-sedoheptulose 7-phosphate isomerase